MWYNDQSDFREALNTMLLVNGAMQVIEKAVVFMSRHSV
jgi:hypothetical protein